MEGERMDRCQLSAADKRSPGQDTEATALGEDRSHAVSRIIKHSNCVGSKRRRFVSSKGKCRRWLTTSFLPSMHEHVDVSTSQHNSICRLNSRHGSNTSRKPALQEAPHPRLAQSAGSGAGITGRSYVC